MAAHKSQRKRIVCIKQTTKIIFTVENHTSLYVHTGVYLIVKLSSEVENNIDVVTPLETKYVQCE